MGVTIPQSPCRLNYLYAQCSLIGIYIYWTTVLRHEYKYSGRNEISARNGISAHFQIQIWRCSTNISDLKFLLIEILPLYNRFLKKILKFVFRSSSEQCLKFFFRNFAIFFHHDSIVAADNF